MNKIFATIALITMSSLANAGGGVGWNKITQLAFQNSDLMIYADNWSNPNLCEQDGAVILKSSDQNFDKAYSLILAAFMSGREIYAYSDGCHTFDQTTFNYIRGFKYLRMR